MSDLADTEADEGTDSLASNPSLEVLLRGRTALLESARARLREIADAEERRVGAGPWPAGCYGSARAWLVFVGPSPGGAARARAGERRPETGMVLLNEPFAEPFQEWSSGFRTSLPPLVEKLTGMQLAEGADLLFAFANFDWIACPREEDVPANSMKGGEPDVLRVLEAAGPRVIVSMSRACHARLQKSLEGSGYTLHPSLAVPVQIPISDRGRRYHWVIDAAVLGGNGPLAQSVLVRSPQHPARMFREEYAIRCASAMRDAVEQAYACTLQAGASAAS